MNESTSPALARGMEMFTKIKMGDLPDEALIYASALCKRYGMCGETMLTAYVVYAQLVEDLACDEDLYKADDRARSEWKEAQAKFKVVRGERITIVPKD